jgi:prepilin-type processing-associated H-X9-DG protein
MGFLQYVQDYDEVLCPNSYVVRNGAYIENYYWYGFVSTIDYVYDFNRGLIQPYMKNVAIEECPTAVDVPGIIIGYAYNNNASLYPGGRPESLAALEQPAETINLADSAYLSSANGSLARALTINPPSSSPTFCCAPNLHGRHSGMASVLWHDGHVKAHKPIPPRVDKSAVATVALHREKSVGFLAHPNHPLGSAGQDYYWLARKPLP